MILLGNILILRRCDILLLSRFILDWLCISDWLINNSLNWSLDCLNGYFSRVNWLLYNSSSSGAQHLCLIIDWSLLDWVWKSVGRLIVLGNRNFRKIRIFSNLDFIDGFLFNLFHFPFIIMSDFTFHVLKLCLIS